MYGASKKFTRKIHQRVVFSTHSLQHSATTSDKTAIKQRSHNGFTVLAGSVHVAHTYRCTGGADCAFNVSVILNCTNDSS